MKLPKSGKYVEEHWMSGPNGRVVTWTREYHVRFLPETMTVEDWLSEENVTDDELLAYVNARTAKEIKESPLYKALK